MDNEVLWFTGILLGLGIVLAAIMGVATYGGMERDKISERQSIACINKDRIPQMSDYGLFIGCSR